MTYAKTQAFTEEQQALANLAKALSHPARIAILQYLASKGTCISGDIAAEIPLARATVSQHLQELKNAGLIMGNVQGLNVCYCINPSGAKDLAELMNAFTAATCSTDNCNC